MQAKLNAQAPLLDIGMWVQGNPGNLNVLVGQVVLVEVFQVNCPGCFLYALPQAIDWHQRFAAQGLTVIGVATAFEDFELNTLENLQRLVNEGEVIGETYKMLEQQKLLLNGRLPYRLPFPVAMDNLQPRHGAVSEAEIIQFIENHFDNTSVLSPAYIQYLHEQVAAHLEKLSFRAGTFETFNLKGTPSQILIDKQGVLKSVNFGAAPELEHQIQQLLSE